MTTMIMNEILTKSERIHTLSSLVSIMTAEEVVELVAKAIEIVCRPIKGEETL